MVLQAKRILAANRVKALSFDGVNDYVEVADSPNLDLTTLTIIAWIKTTYTGVGYVRVFSRHADTTSWPLNPYQIAISGTGRPTIIIGDSVNYEKTPDADPINDDTWHMLAGVVTGSELQMWIDDELKETATQTITPYNYDGRAAVAKASTKYYPGLTGSVLIYSRALSKKEIRAHYYYGKKVFAQPEMFYHRKISPVLSTKATELARKVA